MPISKSELEAAVAEKAGLDKQTAAKAVSAFLQTVIDGLVSGEEIRIAGFGSFTVKDVAERKGRNPRTGEEIDIPAQRKTAFKPSKPLTDAVNGKSA